MNEKFEIVEIFNNYIKKSVLVENTDEMSDDCFCFYTEDMLDPNRNEKIVYEYSVMKENTIHICPKLKNNMKQKYISGSISINKDNITIKLPKAFIKRNFYNSITDVIYEKNLKKNIMLNYKYIENFPNWLLSKKEKVGIFSFSKSTILSNLNVELYPINLIIINKKSLDVKLYFNITIYGINGLKDENYNSAISMDIARFRKFMNKVISERYKSTFFGKQYNSLNKKELKFIELINY